MRVYRSLSSEAPHITATLVICASLHDAHVAIIQGLQDEPAVMTIDCMADPHRYVIFSNLSSLMTLRLGGGGCV